MTRTIPLILLIAGFFLLWLLYLNRSSARIQEATGVIAIAIIGTLFFVLKDDSVKKTIYSTYFISTEQNRPIFFSEDRIINHHYLNQSVIFGNYIRRLSNEKQKSVPDFCPRDKTILDLHAISILNHLLTFYGRHWYLEIESRDTPSGKIGTYAPVLFEGAQNDLLKLPIESLPSSLEKNRFFQDRIPVSDVIALPKHTKMDFTYHEGENPYFEYRFHKPFSFDITIRTKLVMGTIGLGIVGEYLGLTDPEAKVVDSSDANVKDYWNATIITHCEATFSKVRPWHPQVVIYKDWSRRLFEDLYNRFDWSVCEENMKDHQDRISRQKIINKLN